LGGLSVKTSFGTIQNQTKNFQQFFYIDGVIGFIPEHDTSFGGESVFQRLVDADLVENVFSICLNSHNGGIITLGGSDPSLYTAPFQYSPLVAGQGYETPLEKVVVGNSTASEPININIIIDSGTNVLLLPNKAYQNVKDQFTGLLCPSTTLPGVCGSTSLFTGECYQYTPAQIAQFPSVSLNLKGATLTITGADYLINNSTTSTTYCFGITNTGIGGLPIIGDVVMQAYYTQFDVANNRLGWAPVNAANC
jgi:cathepsin D